MGRLTLLLMYTFALQYKIARTRVRVTVIGVVPSLLESSYLERFSDNGDCADNSIVLETHLLNSDTGSDLQHLLLQYHVDTINKHWIDLSADEWMALFNEQDARLVLFLNDSCVFSKAFTSILLFLFKRFTRDRGAFFHSAGIYIGGRCYMFLAPSGTGKTTLSLRAQKSGLPVFSDEMTFIAKNKEHFMAYSSPFGRITHGPLEAPLGGIFFLKQGKAAKFSRINPSQALARAWQDSYYRDTVLDLFGQRMRFKNRTVTPAERLKIFNLWHELFSTIPCFEMEFPLDFDDWHKLVELVENV